MLRTSVKLKGHRFERTKCSILFYEEKFFSIKKKSDDEPKEREPEVVKIPMKINEDGEDSRSNTSYVKVNAIEFFDNKAENVMGVLDVLKHRVVAPRRLDNEGEEAKSFVHFLKFVCMDTARYTLDSICKTARQELWDQEFAGNNAIDIVEEDVVRDESQLYLLIEEDWQPVPEGHDNVEAYRIFLLKEYRRMMMNGIYQVVFGADAYRAFRDQKEYLKTAIVKPFGVSVEAAFRRVDVIANLMTHFPPTARRGRMANSAQWALFEDEKNLNDEDIREIKYNLLPEPYKEKMDNLEEDWVEMTYAKFLLEAQKCEQADKRATELARSRNNKGNNKNNRKKRKHDDAGDESDEDRSSKRSKKHSRNSKSGRDRDASRPPRQCELCKAAGAPEQVYRSHYTNQCNKVDEYKKKLQFKSSKGRSEFRTTERPTAEQINDMTAPEIALTNKCRYLEKKLKSYKKNSKKKGKKSDNSSISSMSSDDDF